MDLMVYLDNIIALLGPSIGGLVGTIIGIAILSIKAAKTIKELRASKMNYEAEAQALKSDAIALNDTMGALREAINKVEAYESMLQDLKLGIEHSCAGQAENVDHLKAEIESIRQAIALVVADHPRMVVNGTARKVRLALGQETSHVEVENGTNPKADESEH